MSTQATKPRRRRLGLLIGAIVATALLTMGITALLFNILERKGESQQPFVQVVNLDENTVDPAVWGQNFPIQYDLYKRTTDQTRTKHGGSEALPNPSASASATDKVAQSKLAEDPRLIKMWSGYAFATDFREERGHAYMLVDQRDTKRVTEFKQPGACLNCHASAVKLYKDLGNGDTQKGFDTLNHMTYAEATAKVEHPVACIDCHDPKTMALRVTRPAFMTGMKELKASQGVKDYDVNRDASAQEMRSFVCGQCHVEYYFKGEGKTLTFPWGEGLKVDNEYNYEKDHKDFTHAITGANVLKAQHPEFEMWNQGVHSRAGVACADCHMPYTREGAAKVSDHWVRSPMLNINRACQGCHNVPEQEIKDRVDQIQVRFLHTRDVSFNALTAFIDDIAAAQKNGTPAAQLTKAREFQRKAQFFIDYVEAENSAGFHAPGEALRILNDATDAIRQGQLALLGKTPSPVVTPQEASPSWSPKPVPPASPSSSATSTSSPTASASPSASS